MFRFGANAAGTIMAPRAESSERDTWRASCHLLQSAGRRLVCAPCVATHSRETSCAPRVRIVLSLHGGVVGWRVAVFLARIDVLHVLDPSVHIEHVAFVVAQRRAPVQFLTLPLQIWLPIIYFPRSAVNPSTTHCTPSNAVLVPWSMIATPPSPQPLMTPQLPRPSLPCPIVSYVRLPHLPLAPCLAPMGIASKPRC